MAMQPTPRGIGIACDRCLAALGTDGSRIPLEARSSDSMARYMFESKKAANAAALKAGWVFRKKWFLPGQIFCPECR